MRQAYVIPPDPEVQQQLAALGATTAAEVAALVASPDDDTAATACWLLGRMGGRRWSGALVRTLRGGRAALWMPASVALSLLDSRRPTPALLALLEAAGPAEQRFAAAYALAFSPSALGDPRVQSAFVRVLGDPAQPPEVRGAAAEGLANGAGACFGAAPLDEAARQDMGDVLIAALHDAAPEVRFWSAFALGALRYRSALPQLRAALGDPGWFGGWWTVGEEAADAIDRIEGRAPPDRQCLSAEQARARERQASA